MSSARPRTAQPPRGVPPLSPGDDPAGKRKRPLTPLGRGLLALAAFFVYAAYLQLNDPDPYLWIPAYLSFAGVTAQAALLNVSWRAPAACAGVSAAWAAAVFWSREWPRLEGGVWAYLDVEEGREIGGLAVVCFTSAVAAAHAARAGGGPTSRASVWLGRACAAAAAVCMVLAVVQPYTAYEKHCGAEEGARAPWDQQE